MKTQTLQGVEVTVPVDELGERVLTPEALEFLADLHRTFEPRRRHQLAARARTQAALDAGESLSFLSASREVRESSWHVFPVPEALADRRVEITGPTDRKMMINAFNSGAKTYMADFEDSNSPTWQNMVHGQSNLMDAVQGRLTYESPDGRLYEVGPDPATLIVRPRGWHLPERHVRIDGQSVSASLFDFGLFMFHNARDLVDQGSGPYLYLPKLESATEARLWNDVIDHVEGRLKLPKYRTKATVLIETLPAAFEMDEILYALRRHAAGLNAGRWDYLFSIIKSYRSRPGFVLPDRGRVTMTSPFMRAYTRLLVQSCHRRNAYAIGGMSAFIPDRKHPDVTQRALQEVRADKEREISHGFDGTWVAHPDLVPVVLDVFHERLNSWTHQLDRTRDDLRIGEDELLHFDVPEAQITEAGVRANVRAALRYFHAWLGGTGAVAIDHLMEDAATAEIARSQLWQWIQQGGTTDQGRRVTRAWVRSVVEGEVTKLHLAGAPESPTLAAAQALLEQTALASDFPDFFTLVGYERLP